MKKQTNTPFGRPQIKQAIEKTAPIAEAIQTGFDIEFNALFLQALCSFCQEYRFPISQLINRSVFIKGSDPKVPGVIQTNLKQMIVMQPDGPTLLSWNDGRKWQKSIGGALVAEKLIQCVFATTLNDLLVALLEVNDGDLLVDFFEPSEGLLPVFGDKALAPEFEEDDQEHCVYSYDETRLLIGGPRFTNLQLVKRND